MRMLMEQPPPLVRGTFRGALLLRAALLPRVHLRGVLASQCAGVLLPSVHVNSVLVCLVCRCMLLPGVPVRNVLVPV